MVDERERWWVGGRDDGWEAMVGGTEKRWEREEDEDTNKG